MLATAGKGTQTIKELAEARIEQDLGRVKLMLAAGLVDISEEKVQKATDRQYYYPFTGGPDEHFAKFLERIGDDAIGKSLSLWNQDAKFSATIFLLLRESNRAAIEDYLKSRRAQRLRAFLIAAEVKGFKDLDPAHPISGAALDMAVLATALLMKGNYFHQVLNNGYPIPLTKLFERTTSQFRNSSDSTLLCLLWRSIWTGHNSKNSYAPMSTGIRWKRQYLFRNFCWCCPRKFRVQQCFHH